MCEHWIAQMLLTFRRVLRGLQQQRGYSTAVIVTLALTIGTTTAIFSAVYAILLKPQPITRPDALVICWERRVSSIRRRRRMRNRPLGGVEPWRMVSVCWRCYWRTPSLRSHR